LGVVLPSLLKPLATDADNLDTIPGENVYAEDLAQLLVGNATDEAYVAAVSPRLSMADWMARHGNRALISEQTVAQAFNDLMTAVTPITDTPPLVNDALIHKLRLTINDNFPELTSVDSHVSGCLPTEATLLLIVLINDARVGPPLPGSLPARVSPDGPSRSDATSSPNALLTAYEASHSRFESVALYDKITKPMGY
jgi:hypothetical protein